MPEFMSEGPVGLRARVGFDILGFVVWVGFTCRILKMTVMWSCSPTTFSFVFV